MAGNLPRNTLHALPLLSGEHAELQIICYGKDDEGTTPKAGSDEDGLPIIQKFFSDEGGEEVVMQMCGFITTEPIKIYFLIADKLEFAWNPGRGRQSMVNKSNVFFMACVTMEHGRIWDFMERRSCMKGPMFESMWMNVINNTVSSLYEKTVVQVLTSYSM